MRWLRRYCWITTLAVALELGFLSAYCDDNNKEEGIGRKYAEQVKKESKVVTDPTIVARIEKIGQSLAHIANTYEVPAKYGWSSIVKFNYEFTVIEDPDPNAFSLPGGQIFINTGLLKMVDNDDELAGVIAHEIAHSAHHHVAKLTSQQSQIDKYVALAALVGILGRVRPQDLNNVLMGVNMLSQSRISRFSIRAEMDADITAVAYMAKSQYNPLGIVDFMRKLDKWHDEHPTQAMGIYQTHPLPFRRITYIRKAAIAYGIPIDIRKLRGVAYASTIESSINKGSYDIVLCGKIFYSASETSKSKAETLAKAINTVLDNNIRPEQILISEKDSSLKVNGQVLLRVEAQGIEDHDNGVKNMLEQAKSVLRRAAWADWLENLNEANKDSDDDE